jgi:hypothetical protein
VFCIHLVENADDWSSFIVTAIVLVVSQNAQEFVNSWGTVRY